MLPTADEVHTAPFAHGLLAHSSTSTSQLPLLVELARLSMTVHDALYSLMKLYVHSPLAYPATHLHLYALNDTRGSTVESVHFAPFLHGLLLHSSTSTSQLKPLKPALHVHLYACACTDEPTVADSAQAAPFVHGELAHSFTSTSQLPVTELLLTYTLHAAVYWAM